ncbi:recombinase family protein [Trichocoleus sp. FACHB-262]|uniref:recombinase family protein n=1 Tax=Trichocoleus sp. FACHB-262 TaxID=2692869 RepID=UPI001685D78F|nr:recombinase family protein [Trichocoleus sp. FACHB-262]MBD2124756.1 recombinase family protein [Trichocoleus sp. FACHB-262]
MHDRHFGYVRVSSREQAQNSNALAQQTARVKEAGVERIFTDVESGASVERPAFKELLNLVREGKVETIIATRWDRLTRNEALYLQLKKLLQDSNVKLRLLDQGEVDFSTAAGELSADMQAIFAVHERRMLRERVTRGFEHRRKKRAAAARAPWGYTTVKSYSGAIQTDKYVLDDRPFLCLLEERPENYLELYSEPDSSERLASRSKAQIAREAVDVFLSLRRPRQVLKYLHSRYGVPKQAKTKLVPVMIEEIEDEAAF